MKDNRNKRLSIRRGKSLGEIKNQQATFEFDVLRIQKLAESAKSLMKTPENKNRSKTESPPRACYGHSNELSEPSGFKEQKIVNLTKPTLSKKRSNSL